jgi:hypothetical protein
VIGGLSDLDARQPWRALAISDNESLRDPKPREAGRHPSPKGTGGLRDGEQRRP